MSIRGGQTPQAFTAEAHGVAPAQVILRWHLQLGALPLPKSATPERQRLNLDVFGFELHEQDIPDAGPGLSDELDRLRRLGVGLAIDDFGTGGTSLAGLRRLPVDTLKVDRTFVAGCLDDPEDSAVVAAIATAAKAAGRHPLASGVETVAQLQMLRVLGYESVQGYLTGKPGDDFGDIVGASGKIGPQLRRRHDRPGHPVHPRRHPAPRIRAPRPSRAVAHRLRLRGHRLFLFHRRMPRRFPLRWFLY